VKILSLDQSRNTARTATFYWHWS